MRIPGALLVVDSSGAITDFMAARLLNEDHLIAVAPDHAETLASIDHRLPALVLLDDTVVGSDAPLLDKYITHRHHVHGHVITATTSLAIATTMTTNDR